MRFGTAVHTSPGKIVLAGGAAVGAGPAGIIVTEIGVRVGSHGSAVPKGQVVPTWVGGQGEKKGMAAAAGGAGDGSTGDFGLGGEMPWGRGERGTGCDKGR